MYLKRYFSRNINTSNNASRSQINELCKKSIFYNSFNDNNSDKKTETKIPHYGGLKQSFTINDARKNKLRQIKNYILSKKNFGDKLILLKQEKNCINEMLNEYEKSFLEQKDKSTIENSKRCEIFKDLKNVLKPSSRKKIINDKNINNNLIKFDDIKFKKIKVNTLKKTPRKKYDKNKLGELYENKNKIIFFKLIKKNKQNEYKKNDFEPEYMKNCKYFYIEEYFEEIFSDLRQKETEIKFDPLYMNKQKDINNLMRAILIDWLVIIHSYYKFLPQTLYLSVILIDNFLQKIEIKRKNLQLVGVASIFIISKYQEIYSPNINEFVKISDKAFNKDDLLKMEKKILLTLDYKIPLVSQWDFLECYRKLLSLNNKVFAFAWFLMELFLLDNKSLVYKMSEIASSAVYISMKIFKIYCSEKFEIITKYKEKDIEDCVSQIKNNLKYNKNNKLQAIRKKFSSPRYYEVSKIKLND